MLQSTTTTATSSSSSKSGLASLFQWKQRQHHPHEQQRQQPYLTTGAGSREDKDELRGRRQTESAGFFKHFMLVFGGKSSSSSSRRRRWKSTTLEAERPPSSVELEQDGQQQFHLHHHHVTHFGDLPEVSSPLSQKSLSRRLQFLDRLRSHDENISKRHLADHPTLVHRRSLALRQRIDSARTSILELSREEFAKVFQAAGFIICNDDDEEELFEHQKASSNRPIHECLEIFQPPPSASSSFSVASLPQVVVQEASDDLIGDERHLPQLPLPSSTPSPEVIENVPLSTFQDEEEQSFNENNAGTVTSTAGRFTVTRTRSLKRSTKQKHIFTLERQQQPSSFSSSVLMDTVLASEQYLQHHQDNHQELSPIDALLQFLAPPIEIFTHPDRSSLYDIWGLCANNKSRPKSSASSITTKFPTLDPPPSTVTSCEDSLDRSSQVLLYHYTADDATVQHSEELQELATLSMEMEARIDEFMAENSLPVTTKTGRFTLERKKKSDITSDNNNSSIDNNHGISNNTNRTCEASTASTSSTPTKRRVGRFIVTE